MSKRPLRTNQRVLPFGCCVVCGDKADVTYPGPYIPTEYPTREWYSACSRHRRNVGRLAAWRRVKAGQAGCLVSCGSTPRMLAAGRP